MQPAQYRATVYGMSLTKYMSCSTGFLLAQFRWRAHNSRTQGRMGASFIVMSHPLFQNES